MTDNPSLSIAGTWKQAMQVLSSTCIFSCIINLSKKYFSFIHKLNNKKLKRHHSKRRKQQSINRQLSTKFNVTPRLFYTCIYSTSKCSFEVHLTDGCLDYFCVFAACCFLQYQNLFSVLFQKRFWLFCIWTNGTLHFFISFVRSILFQKLSFQ